MVPYQQDEFQPWICPSASKYILQRPSLLNSLVHIPNTRKREVPETAVISTFQHMLERRPIDFFPNFVLVVWCDNINVDDDGDLAGSHWAKIESLIKDEDADYRLECASP